MNILVTGAKGFVGKNLVETLKAIKTGKNKTRPNIMIDNIYEFDVDTSEELLKEYCKKSDFVYNLAGVNRPKNQEDFMQGNFGFASKLLNILKENNNNCPIMLASSIQATLIGRYENSEYGKSKLAGENLFFDYAKETNSKVLVYRFQNLFGKWCKPNYNSVVATFCNNIANDLDIQVNDPNTELELVYIDDLVEEMLDALEGKEHHCEFDNMEIIPKQNGKFCYIPKKYNINLGKIVELLNKFKQQVTNYNMLEIPNESFEKKLYSTYLSYLPSKKIKYNLKMNIDDRGSFTEILKTKMNGQFSVNISKPGIKKGEHWHNSKWEIFVVVSGHGLIQERKIGTNEIIEFEVNGDKLEAVQMLPGYTHNIINLSNDENLVTLMWANEQFNISKPDTYFEEVENEHTKRLFKY